MKAERYEPTITTLDLDPQIGNKVGSTQHARLLDILGALRNRLEEEIVSFVEKGFATDEIAPILNRDVSVLRRILREVYRRAGPTDRPGR